MPEYSGTGQKAACAQPADHAAFQPRAAADDLRHGGLHKLHIHYAGADDLARHGCDLAGDKLTAVLPGLYGLGFAKIQPRVLDGLGLKRQLPGHGLVPHGLDLQRSSARSAAVRSRYGVMAAAG